MCKDPIIMSLVVFLQNLKTDDIIRYLDISRLGLKAIMVLCIINVLGNSFIIIKQNTVLGMSSAILALLMAMLSLIGIYVIELTIDLIKAIKRVSMYEEETYENDLLIKDQDQNA